MHLISTAHVVHFKTGIDAQRQSLSKSTSNMCPDSCFFGNRTAREFCDRRSDHGYSHHERMRFSSNWPGAESLNSRLPIHLLTSHGEPCGCCVGLFGRPPSLSRG